MKSYFCTLVLYLCCSSNSEAQFVYMTKGNNTIKYRYDYSGIIESLKNSSDAADSLICLSMQEYCLLNAKKFDSLAFDMEKHLGIRVQNSVNTHLKSMLESNDAATSDAIDGLESILNKEEAQVYYTSDLLKKISASFKYYYRTQSKLGFLPLRNKYDAFVHHQKQQKQHQGKFFNQTKLSLSPEDLNYSVFSEVYADYFSIVKFTIGSVLTTGRVEEGNEDEGSDSLRSSPSSKALNKLTGGGGNLVLNLSYPICIYVNDRTNLKFSLSFQNRIAFDMPLNQTNLKGYPINLEPSLLSSIYFGGLNDILALTVDLKCARLFGNALFFDLLEKENKSPFFLNTLSLGIQVNQKFNVSMNFYMGDKYVQQYFPSALSVGLSF